MEMRKMSFQEKLEGFARFVKKTAKQPSVLVGEILLLIVMPFVIINDILEHRKVKKLLETGRKYEYRKTRNSEPVLVIYEGRVNYRRMGTIYKFVAVDDGKEIVIKFRRTLLRTISKPK